MKLLFPISICLFAVFALAIPDLSSDKNNYEDERTLTVMRKIGHELLLSVDDKRSRILPIEKAEGNAYLIRFETPFQFQTPHLVDIVQRNIVNAKLPSAYIVSVSDCDGRRVLYSYEFIPGTNKDELACLTRENDFGCYTIAITFADTGHTAFFNRRFVAVLLPSLLLSIFSFIYFGKRKNIPTPHNPDIVKIGGTSFDSDARVLIYGDHQKELTEKEARILKLFAERQNEIIERDQLLKEVWEDEGVFVGRSLDVFVSRLRKKLEIDKSIKLANVHGRGYKLEVVL